MAKALLRKRGVSFSGIIPRWPFKPLEKEWEKERTIKEKKARQTQHLPHDRSNRLEASSLPLRLFFLIALATIILSAYNLDSNTVQPAMAQYSEETAEESSAPTTTDIGAAPFVIEEDCASVEVEGGYYLYYSPTNPNYFCVHPATQSAQPIVGGGAQVPSTCAWAPDYRFYCSADWKVTAATLQELYAQGLLPPL